MWKANFNQLSKKISPCRTTAFQFPPRGDLKSVGGTLVHERRLSPETRFKQHLLGARIAPQQRTPRARHGRDHDEIQWVTCVTCVCLESNALLNRDRNVCESGLMPRGVSQICRKEPQKGISRQTNTPGGQRWSLLFVLQGESESFILKCSTINIIPASCV